MNNKPVAWMIRRDENITKGVGHEMQLTFMDATRPEFWLKGKVAKGYTVYPLYTHPVKELTDKEITQVFDECYPNNGDGDVVTLIDFARAILKKAQEK